MRNYSPELDAQQVCMRYLGIERVLANKNLTVIHHMALNMLKTRKPLKQGEKKAVKGEAPCRTSGFVIFPCSLIVAMII